MVLLAVVLVVFCRVFRMILTHDYRPKPQIRIAKAIRPTTKYPIRIVDPIKQIAVIVSIIFACPFRIG